MQEGWVTCTNTAGYTQESHRISYIKTKFRSWDGDILNIYF